MSTTERDAVKFEDGSESLIDADGMITLDLLPGRDGLTMNRYFADDVEEGKVQVAESGATAPVEHRPYEEVVAEILGRWSVTDLVEMHDADLADADEKFHASNKEINVETEGEHQLIRFWIIRSGGKRYEVRRFQQFAFCSCPAFFFRKRPCKHIARSALVLCGNCGESFAKAGKLCYRCDGESVPAMRSSRPVTFTMQGSL